MPIYEYVCQECKGQFELLVRGNTTVRCPRCQGQKVDKQLSVFAAATKGGGEADVAAPAPCGQCGDSRGPGSCALN